MTSTWDQSLPAKGMAAWEKATERERQEAAVHATQFIETLPFKGSKATDIQSLSWPRTGVFRDDGSPIRGVPDEVRNATMVVAGFILAKIPFDVPAVAWVFKEIGHLLKEDIPVIDRDVTWH